MPSVISSEGCVSNVCCAESATHEITDLVELAITDLPQPWGYYLMDEGDDTPTRVDSTGQSHDLESTQATHPARVAGLITPWANNFDATDEFQSELAPMDTLADSWSWHSWIFLDSTPEADGTIFSHGEGTENQTELHQLWDGTNLYFQLQIGYYAPPNDTIPYLVTASLLNATLNKWFAIGVSHGSGYDIISVDGLSTAVLSMDLDAATPPNHASQNVPFVIGGFSGYIGPVGIWTPSNHLTEANLQTLWNGGNGLALSF